MGETPRNRDSRVVLPAVAVRHDLAGKDFIANVMDEKRMRLSCLISSKRDSERQATHCDVHFLYRKERKMFSCLSILFERTGSCDASRVRWSLACASSIRLHSVYVQPLGFKRGLKLNP